jgi:hypothetical protein
VFAVVMGLTLVKIHGRLRTQIPVPSARISSNDDRRMKKEYDKNTRTPDDFSHLTELSFHNIFPVPKILNKNQQSWPNPNPN